MNSLTDSDRRSPSVQRRDSRQRPSRVLFVVGAFDTLVIIVGLFLANNVRWGSDAFTAGAVCAAAIMTLVGLLYYLISIRGIDTAESFRHAIAASFMLVYLLLVAIYAFPSSDEPRPIPPITSALLTNFTTLAIAVTGFYFGGTAVEKTVEKWKAQGGGRSQEDSPRPNSEPITSVSDESDTRRQDDPSSSQSQD